MVDIRCDEEDDVLSDIANQNELQDGWTHLTSSQIGAEFSFGYEPVDGDLLRISKAEIKAVCANARRLMNKQSNADVTVSDVVNYFLDSVIDDIFKTISAGIPATSRPPSGTDVADFIRVLAYLSVYRVVPSKFFDPDNVFLFPASKEFSYSKFEYIFRALKKKRSDSTDNVSTWDAPFKTDEVIRNAERHFSRVSSSLAFIRKRSILSIDDDQYRLKSAMTEAMGFARINNPKKAFGPVSTNVVSLTTSIILGMRLAGRGEGFGDVVKVLLQLLHCHTDVSYQ